jgi:hypothetical protein
MKILLLILFLINILLIRNDLVKVKNILYNHGNVYQRQNLQFSHHKINNVKYPIFLLNIISMYIKSKLFY